MDQVTFETLLTDALSGKDCSNAQLIELIRVLQVQRLLAHNRARQLMHTLWTPQEPPSTKLPKGTSSEVTAAFHINHSKIHKKLNRQLHANRELQFRINVLTGVIEGMGGIVPVHTPVEDKKYDHTLAMQEINEVSAGGEV